MSPDPVPEATGRRVVTARAAVFGPPACEVCHGTFLLEWSHRVAVGRGGTWAPSNGLLLDRRCHAWAHAFPERSRPLGWHVTTGNDPATRPVWITPLWPGPGWYLLEDDGLLRAVDPDAVPDLDPPLPPPGELFRLLPEHARGALL